MALPAAICPQCLGAKWVCEEHTDKPWPHDGCDGPGVPCPSCNADYHPDKPPHWRSLLE